MLRLRLLSMVGLGGALSLGAACSSGGGETGGVDDVDNGFESDDPSARSAAERSSAGSADAGTAAPSAESDSLGGDDAKRTVEEADILKVEGTRLYTLSRYGGLAVVDIADPDHMKVLGRRRIDGTPFEMYVENGRAFVMLTDFGRYVREGGNPYGRWVQSSEILALDVQNPAAIGEISHFDVPGTIADSRLVGDAAYVVTFEDGYCWGCQTNPATVVTSFNVAGAITKSDQLIYSSAKKNYSSWKRSVSATSERLYIAGPEWSWEPGTTTNGSSIIQVVDITDPTGKLKKGVDLPIAGQINSRWQIDEYAGVLRVVSQFGRGWGGNGVNPKVQTFTVASANSITPLGSTELVLPSPESLRSVRFDGTRGYAITAEQTDPLYTIDLSNPAAPKQAAALEIPGWIFHMEPRGDRLVGFGYDGTTWDAHLAVSLFDVSDLSNPTMLKRVSFGSAGGQVAEDQDRIHKSVRILDQEGLILVPFASYGHWSNETCEGPKSGIQLIDFTKDTLTLRGLAPQWGMPRRAFTANGRLLAMSDRNVTTFDIASRDTPVKTAELDLSNPAYRLAELPNHIASITNDWWSGEAMLSLTPKANADDADVTGKVSLATLAPQSASTCSGKNGWTSWYEARIFGNGNTVYVTVPVYTYEANKRGGKLIAAAIDVSNPMKPVIAGKVETPFVERDTSNGYWGWYGGFCDGYSFYSYYGGASGGLVASGEGIVRVGTKLAYLEVDNEYIKYPTLKGDFRYTTKTHRRIHVVDFATPSAPVAHAPIALSDSLGTTPLQVYKGTVLTSRWIQSTLNPSKVRFYIDRIDLNGTAPTQLSSVNTPGSLLLADEASSRFVTSDYKATRVPASSWSDCQQKLDWRAYFDDAAMECVSVTRDLKLSDVADTKVTLRQKLDLPSQSIGGVQVSDDRVYVTHYKRYDYSSYNSSDPYASPKLLEDGGLWAIGGVRAGQLSIVSQLVGDAQWPLAAHGTKVALYTDGGLALYDTTTPTASLIKEQNLRGWGYASHVLLGDDKAVCSLGEWGLQSFTY